MKNIVIDKNAPVPIYYQIQTALKQMIATHELNPDEQITSEEALSQYMGISRMTVRHALDKLVAEGLLYRRHGWGTFVAEPKGIKPEAKEIALLINKRFYFPGEAFYMPILEGVEKEISLNTGYKLIFSTFNSEAADNIPADLAKWHSNGVIIVGAIGPEVVDNINKQGIPIVLVHFSIDGKDYDTVTFDDQGGAYQAVQYLFSLGHEKIALIKGPPDRSMALRWQGVVAAFNKRGIPIDIKLVQEAEGHTVEAGAKATMAIFQAAEKPTAVFAFSDGIAAGVLKAARDMRLSVPADISVIGYDNIFWSKYLDPPLTTVNSPKEEAGRHAASRLIQIIEKGKAVAPMQRVESVKIIERRSCGLVHHKKEGP